MAIRTKKPLALPLAPLIWKLLVGEPVSVEDLEDTDCMYVQTLRSIRDIDQSGVTSDYFHEVIPLQTFEGQSCTGKVFFSNIDNVNVFDWVVVISDCSHYSRRPKYSVDIRESRSILRTRHQVQVARV